MISTSLQKTISALMGLVVGIALVGAGVFVYTNYLGPSEDAPSPATMATSELQQNKVSENPVGGFSEQIADRKELNLEDLLKQSKSSRDVVLHNHLMNANVDFAVGVYGRAQTIEPLNLRLEVREAAVRRLARLDPEAALREINRVSGPHRHSLTSAVFEEWSVANLDAAMDEALGLDKQTQRYALEGVLISRYDLSEIQQIELARKLGLEEVVADSRAVSLAGQSIDNPDEAWIKFLEDHGSDMASLTDAQSALLHHIVDSLMERGETEELARAVDVALQSNSNSPAAQLLLESWVNTDPSMAFHATATIGDTDIRTQMRQTIVSAWIGLDPITVLDSIELIPIDIQDWSKQQALAALSETSPAEAAKRLRILSDDSKGSVAGTIVTNWAITDPQAARDWVRSAYEDQEMRWGLMYRLVRALATTDSELAMKWALEEPVNPQQRGRGLEVDVIVTVAYRGNIESALSLVAQARDVENRQWSYVRIGGVLAQRGRIDEALNLLDEIPERYQNIYREQLMFNWVYAEPDVAFARIDSLASDSVKADLARTLAFYNSMSHMFSDKQMRQLKEYLPERLQHLIE
ncbi:MAG: hypothetical protein F4X44_02205 [Gammaproteobacteria bacterium]|nr:hypothetical protein [Gammaproteobacteria bacterium]MYD79408.1 hypothetical protein [Gammaproteobacteria bacterium]